MAVLLIGLASSTGSFAFSADPPTRGALDDEAHGLIRAMLQERAKLVSGQLKITGTLSSKGDEIIKGESHGRLAFNFDRGQVRYDHEKTIEARPGNAPNDPARVDVNTWKLRYIRQPKYSASWDSTTYVQPTRFACSPLTLLRPDVRNGAQVSRHHLIDIRSCGLLSCIEFQSSKTHGGMTFRKDCERLQQMSTVSIERENGQAILTLESRFGISRLVIDTDHGHCPLELHVTSKSDPAVQFTKVEWKQEKGIWIPKSLFLRLDAPQAPVQREYSLEFEWQRVNEPPAERLFDYHSFGAIPFGVEVQDFRGEKPVILGKWDGGVLGGFDLE